MEWKVVRLCVVQASFSERMAIDLEQPSLPFDWTAMLQGSCPRGSVRPRGARRSYRENLGKFSIHETFEVCS